jgi:hypothetical protein
MSVPNVYSLFYLSSVESIACSCDDRRNGLFWNDINFDGVTLRAVGKPKNGRTPNSHVRPAARLTATVVFNSRQPGEWPVFPTAHAPTFYRHAREGLSERGFSDEDVETFPDKAGVEDVLHEYGYRARSLASRRNFASVVVVVRVYKPQRWSQRKRVVGHCASISGASAVSCVVSGSITVARVSLRSLNRQRYWLKRWIPPRHSLSPRGAY